MSASSPASPPTEPAAPLRRARVAVAALFLTNGALLANLLPRYPEIKAALGLANSTYGLALAAFPAGAILAGLAAAGLIRRLGSARLAVLGTALTALGLLLAALVLIAIGGTLVEDSGNSWATLYLSRDLGAASSIAAIGYIALVGAQFVGRLLADGLVDRLGQRAVARGGGAIIALGMGTALAVPTVPGTIAGFALAGLGSASLVPAAMQQADDLPGLRPGTGLTVVSWLMRLGFLASPPLVGLVADSAELRTGLLVVPLAGLLVVLLAGALPPRRAPDPGRERELSAAG